MSKRSDGPIIGYVVLDDTWKQPMLLDHRNDAPRGGILLNGRHGTLFPTRARAYGAVKRSAEYSHANNLGWSCDYRIFAIRSHMENAS